MRSNPAATPDTAGPVPPSSSVPRALGTGAAPSDQRQHLRFDKVFPVMVESILFGEMPCVARNVSAGGIFLETHDPLPLGARVRIRFLTQNDDGEIVAFAEVKNHYFINFVQGGESRSVTGMALRFSGFEHDGERDLRACLDRYRILH